MPDRTQKILQKVLKKIKPSKAESEDMNALVKKVLSAAKKAGSKKALICGSVEKGTWLAQRKELDMFLLFSPSVSREELEKKGLGLAKKIVKLLKGKFIIAYAEHPYLRATIAFKKKKYGLDIVPAYDIRDPSKIKSAVDRTPHHVKFVKEHMTGRLADEVRLLKAFTKASGCYGADIKTRGFSGYLCELLTIKYGSFLSVLRAAAEVWNAGQVITFNSKIKPSEVFEKFRSPLIVIDPVDPNRNVAAAVSAETFFKFIQASSHFLRMPSEKHFFQLRPKPYSLAEISREISSRRTRLYLIKFSRPKIIDDILWSQMRRALYIIEKILEEGGFRVLRSAEWANKKICVLSFELDVWQVPKIVKHVGPSIYSLKQTRAFLDHYSDRPAFIEKDFWVVETERKHTTALHYLKDFFAQSEKTLFSRGIPNKLGNIKTATIVSGADAIKLIKDLPEEYRIFMREYFEKDLRPY